MLSVNTIDILSTVSFGMMFGIVGTALMKMYSSHPLLEAVANTTLVFLENTKEVWKPVVDFSLVFLKPFAPLVILVLDVAVKAMVVFGFMTVNAVRKVTSYANYTLALIKESGMSVGTAINNAVENVKDVIVSLGSLSKALASLTVRLIKTASFIVNSFDQVSDFLYRFLYETSTVTWQDMVDVALPFFVVSCILGLVVWRFSRLFVTAKAPVVDCEEPCKPFTPRRSQRLLEQSNRLARKRAMMSSCDAPFSS